MSQKLVLIDGHSILNRAFYGVPDLSNAEGLHTNAIYGFLNIMFKILEEEKPEYLAVAFDVHAPTFRHKMYEAYKGTRKPMPEELREQVPVMKEILKAMHITIMEQAGLEADDILGTLAKKQSRPDWKYHWSPGTEICCRLPRIISRSGFRRRSRAERRSRIIMPQMYWLPIR